MLLLLNPLHKGFRFGQQSSGSREWTGRDDEMGWRKEKSRVSVTPVLCLFFLSVCLMLCEAQAATAGASSFQTVRLDLTPNHLLSVYQPSVCDFQACISLWIAFLSIPDLIEENPYSLISPFHSLPTPIPLSYFLPHKSQEKESERKSWNIVANQTGISGNERYWRESRNLIIVLSCLPSLAKVYLSHTERKRGIMDSGLRE